MKKLLSSLFILCLFVSSAVAQERTVTGTVKGKDDGLPLPGVSVRIKGTTSGTQSGPNGVYSIKVPGNNTVLVFTYIGYSTQESNVGSRSSLNITMSTDANQLSEVVVTALGIERQKKELGYAATTVSEAVVNRANPVNLANGLQGKVSGLNVSSLNNGVFENVRINLRGIRSLTGNNNPLLVVDGVPAELNYLSSLNPNDIENVSILKGSSSAAIYGPDARNGVIVVTTKKGTADKPIITFSNSTQLQNVSFFPKLQNQFGSGGSGHYDPIENWSWGPAFDGTMRRLGPILADQDSQVVRYSALPDERKSFFNTGTVIQNDVSFTAKNFYLSAQDAVIHGIVPDDRNRRTGVRMNTSREYGNFRATFNTNYIQQNYNTYDADQQETYFSEQNSGNNEGLMNLIFNTQANVPLTSYKDIESNKFAQFNNYYNDYGLNPYWAIDNWRKEGRREDLITNLDLNYRPSDWLSLTYRAALTTNTTIERSYSKGEIPTAYGVDERGFTLVRSTVEERAYKLQRLSSELFANLNKQVTDDFKLTGVVGTYVRQNQSRNTLVGANNLVVPGLYNIDHSTGQLSGSSSERKTRLFSIYANAGVSYRGWANLEVTGRNDWTSVLAIGNNSYFYPGVSGSLVLSDALPAFQNSEALSYLKLRAAWNKTGNADISPYLLAPTFSQILGYPYGSLPGYTANNTYYTRGLKPEFIESTEVGIETGFLKGRINVEATFFNQNNTDQIVGVRVSESSGYNRAYVNAASFVNKGVELDLRFTPLFSFPNGRVEFRANATYNDSKVENIYNDLDELAIGGYTIAGNFAVKNEPAFVLKANDYLRDSEGRIIVDSKTGLPSSDPTLKSFGRTMPDWIIGFNPSVKWKSFSLSGLLEFKGGHVMYNGYGPGMAWTGVSEATAYNDRKPFILPNSSIMDPNNPGSFIANTSVPVAVPQDFYTGVYGDVYSNFITSANSWRLREVSLSYDFPEKLLSGQKYIKGLSIALTGRNLFLWVPKANVYQDPDFNSFNYDAAIGSTNNTVGVTSSQVNPPVRTFGANVTVRF